MCRIAAATPRRRVWRLAAVSCTCFGATIWSKAASGVASRCTRGNGTVRRLSKRSDGDASGESGISTTSRASFDLAAAVDGDGSPIVAWSEYGESAGQVFLRANPDVDGIAGTLHVADAAMGDTVQSVLDQNDFGPGDAILVRGVHAAGFTVRAGDSGVAILGVPGSSVPTVTIDGVTDVRLQRMTVLGALVLKNAGGLTIVENSVLGGTMLENVSATTLAHNTLEGAVGADARHRRDGRGDLSKTQFKTPRTALLIASSATGQITRNRLTASGTGLAIDAAFTGEITANHIFGNDTGVAYRAAAALAGNDIHDNGTGVIAAVASEIDGFGFAAGSASNEIHDNAVGVELTGRMQNQHIFANGTGVAGTAASAILGPAFGDFEHGQPHYAQHDRR